MANNPQQSLFKENLENLKLRQLVQELESQISKNEIKHSEDLFIITQENENLKRQHEIEIKTKIRQLHYNNKKLMEELVDARKCQCKAEEEVVLVSEQNFQLTYDLKNMQQEYEKCRTDIGEISMETIKKEQELQKVFKELQIYKEKNIKIQQEFENVSAYCKKIKSDIRKRDSQILQLSSYMEESNKKSLEQEVLEKTIDKLQEENSILKIEIQETDANRSSMAETLYKNKDLLATNKKLKIENDKLLNEKSDLENQVINNKDNIKELKKTLEATQHEFSELKEKNLKLETEIQSTNLLLKNNEELLNQKCDLEKENLALKRKFEGNQKEFEKNKEAIKTLVTENCKLKQIIYNLETSNFQKLQIIAKLKDASDYSICES